MQRKIFIYIIGIFILAIGITLATQANLGISPLLSLPYLGSYLTIISFPRLTLWLYLCFVVIQLAIYIQKGWYRQLTGPLLQIIISFLFSTLLDTFLSLIPNFANLNHTNFFGSAIGRLLILLIGTFLTGVGASMMLLTKFVPTPADGVVQTIATAYHYPTGFIKNFLDISLVCFTILLSLIFQQTISIIGIGTLISMIGVGRVMSWFDCHFKHRIEQWL